MTHSASLSSGSIATFPTRFEAAYKLPALYRRGTTGKGQTIVVVDALHHTDDRR